MLLRAVLVACCWSVAAAAVAQSVQPDDFFADDLYHDAELSPNGQLVMVKTLREGFEQVEILDPRSGKFMVLANTGDGRTGTAAELRWLGDRTVMILARSGISMRWRHWLGRFTYDGEEFSETFMISLGAPGFLVDPLVDQESAFLFSLVADKGGGVYKVQIDSQGLVDDTTYRTKNRLNGRITDGLYWYSDRAGQLRFAVREGKDGNFDLWLRQKTRWKKIFTIAGQARFKPLSYFSSRQKLLVLTDDENKKLVARELDVVSGQFGETLYEHPTLDLSNIIINPADGRPLAIEYTEDGRVRRDYLVAEQDGWLSAVSERFPDQTAYVMSRDVDDQFAVVLVESPTSRGTLLYRDGPNNELIEIGSVAPQLDSVAMAKTLVVRAKSQDGFDIEGYLTLPSHVEQPPLLVVSHGGPIGVRDANHFDYEAQYFAALGAAVLRTNYRGSSGFGERFEKAGEGEWGRAIEDDIDLLVDRVIAEHNIDPRRICAHGGSYGGYSAMMNIIRRPERYRCASSLSGPTDLPLMFSSSDWSQDEDLVARMREILGDPKTDLASLKEVSPLYRAVDLGRPLFLAHGQFDQRVDIEHFNRMDMVMKLLGRPIETMILPAGHGFQMRSDSRAYYRRLSTFLIKHLELDAQLAPPLTDTANDESPEVASADG